MTHHEVILIVLLTGNLLLQVGDFVSTMEVIKYGGSEGNELLIYISTKFKLPMWDVIMGAKIFVALVLAALLYPVFDKYVEVVYFVLAIGYSLVVANNIVVLQKQKKIAAALTKSE